MSAMLFAYAPIASAEVIVPAYFGLVDLLDESSIMLLTSNGQGNFTVSTHSISPYGCFSGSYNLQSSAVLTTDSIVAYEYVDDPTNAQVRYRVYIPLISDPAFSVPGSPSNWTLGHNDVAIVAGSINTASCVGGMGISSTFEPLVVAPFNVPYTDLTNYMIGFSNIMYPVNVSFAIDPLVAYSLATAAPTLSMTNMPASLPVLTYTNAAVSVQPTFAALSVDADTFPATTSTTTIAAVFAGMRLHVDGAAGAYTSTYTAFATTTATAVYTVLPTNQ